MTIKSCFRVSLLVFRWPSRSSRRAQVNQWAKVEQYRKYQFRIWFYQNALLLKVLFAVKQALKMMAILNS
jgi:hypothetical protein